jgi:mRNA interferase MazF
LHYLKNLKSPSHYGLGIFFVRCINFFFSVYNKTSKQETTPFTYNVIRSKFGFSKEVFKMNVKRGELYYADLSPVVGSEQGGIRPVLVVQNDIGNKYSPTIIAAAVTSKINKAKLPTHIELPSAYGLAKDSVILLEQIRTLDKRRLKERIGELPPATMLRVNRAILISLGFPVNN